MAKNHNVRLEEHQIETLTALIQSLDSEALPLYYGGNPSLSLFLQAIAEGRIALSRPWSEGELKLLLAALRSWQSSESGDGVDLFNILEKAEVGSDREPALKKRLLRLPTTEVEASLDDLIRNRLPFRMIDYQDIMNKLWSFDCYWADWWDSGDGVLRLRCWCQQTENNEDILPLRHNWNFVPARSPNLSVLPLDGQWREEGLEQVESELLFFGGMAKAYKSHPDDLYTQLIDFQGETVLSVHRQVWSSFWLFKFLSRYIDSVAIAQPTDLALLWRNKLVNIIQKIDSIPNLC
jgi:hypothetical protein